jgi:hypothetical protein
MGHVKQISSNLQELHKPTTTFAHYRPYNPTTFDAVHDQLVTKVIKDLPPEVADLLWGLMAKSKKDHMNVSPLDFNTK